MFQKLIASFLAACELFMPGMVPSSGADTILVEMAGTAVYADGELAGEDGAVRYDEEASVVTITAPGVYTLTGELDGSIVVDLSGYAKDHDYMEAEACPEAVVTLVLDNATIQAGESSGITFSHVYECDMDLDGTATAIHDTTQAGANLVLAKGSANLVSGSQEAERRTAAVISAASMNLVGEEDSVLHIQSGSNGISSLGHLLVNGGKLTVFSQEDGITVNHGNGSLMVAGGDLSVCTHDGDGLHSDGYLLFNDGSLLVSAGRKNAPMSSGIGTVINGGTVAAFGYDGDTLDSGDQGVMMLDLSSGIQDITLVDEDGFVAFSFDLTRTEYYTSMEVGRTFRRAILSIPSFDTGCEYTVWTGTTLSGPEMEYVHGVLQDPGAYRVTDGYPLKFSNATIGSGSTFAASYLASVYDMATMLDRANGLDVDMAKLDEAVDVVASLDTASDLQEAAANAEAAIDQVDRSTLMGNDLWRRMHESLQLEAGSTSAKFLLWDQVTDFSGVAVQQVTLSALDLPADNLDLPANTQAYSTPLDLPADGDAMDLPVSLYELDLPANSLDLSAQGVSNASDSSMAVSGRVLFYDGKQASTYFNPDGLMITGDVIDSKVAGKNALRLDDQASGMISNVSISKYGDGEDPYENAALSLSGRSSLYLYQSDLFSKAAYSAACYVSGDSSLTMEHVTLWTNGDDSDALVVDGGTVTARKMIFSTTGADSAVLRVMNGSLIADSMDINSAGEDGHLILVEPDGKAVLTGAVGAADLGSVAQVSGSLDLISCDLSGNPTAISLSGSSHASVTNGALSASGTLFVLEDANGEIAMSAVDMDAEQLLSAASSDLIFYADAQRLSGRIDADDTSHVTLKLRDGSVWTGTGCEAVDVEVEDGSSWIVPESCEIGSLLLPNGAKLVDSNGHDVTILDADGKVLRSGSEISVRVMGRFN